MMKLLILLSLVTFNIFGNENFPKADFSSPQTTFKYYLKTIVAYKKGNQEGLALAAKTFNLNHIDPALRTNVGETAAIQLINTLDRLEKVDVLQIPKEMGSLKKYTYKEDTVFLDNTEYHVEISLTLNNQKQWKFSKETLDTIQHYERFTKSAKVVDGVDALITWKERIKNRMPEWTSNRSFILLNGQWLGLIFLVFIAFIIEKLIKIYITSLTIRLLARKGISISEELRRKFTAPIGVFSFAGVWLVGVKLLEFSPSILSWFLRGGIVVFTVGAVIAVHHIVDVLCLFLEKKALESENKFDDILVPLVRKTSKFLVIAVGIIFIGDSLTLNMKSILAGMGIGGIAFALAAKDTISNIFGSITVLLDRPFRIGDWVVIDDKVEGTIEEVGLRSCRIRTFYNSQITLPNGKLTNAHIDNYGVRRYRRFNTKLGIQYDTPVEKIEAFCEGIRQIILAHPHTRKDYFHVYLNGLGSSSLDILLYCFWEVPDWSQELQEKHRLLLDILRLAKEMEIDFAFPTQTLHTIPAENRNHKEVAPAGKIHERASELAKEISANKMTFNNHRSTLESINQGDQV
ncbi:MAG: mechanosensitive ion channel family protein [Oligoflexia bacterium]|nr:mechanosensitive ion channel family protein [Oligoflexia bacterium]